MLAALAFPFAAAFAGAGAGSAGGSSSFSCSDSTTTGLAGATFARVCFAGLTTSVSASESDVTVDDAGAVGAGAGK